MEPCHFQGVIELQELAFPPPFDRELLWKEEHLNAHTMKFPMGQVVALDENHHVVGSCSNTVLDSDWFDRELPWKDMVGGYSLNTFDADGLTLYGLDISVHPNFRRQGIGRDFYKYRLEALLQLGYERYATTCRIPDFSMSGLDDPKQYCREVDQGIRFDRTLSPLLKYGVNFRKILADHWDDPESGNFAASLEWWI